MTTSDTIKEVPLKHPYMMQPLHRLRMYPTTMPGVEATRNRPIRLNMLRKGAARNNANPTLKTVIAARSADSESCLRTESSGGVL